MAIRVFGLLMAMVSARIYIGCKQFPRHTDNQLGEIAQVQLVFSFLYALLLKLETGKDNSSEWEDEAYDIMMVFVNFLGLAAAVLRPALEYVFRVNGNEEEVNDYGDAAEYFGEDEVNDEEDTAEAQEYSGEEDMAEAHEYSGVNVKEYLQETRPGDHEPIQVVGDVELGNLGGRCLPGEENESQRGEPDCWS